MAKKHLYEQRVEIVSHTGEVISSVTMPDKSTDSEEDANQRFTNIKIEFLVKSIEEVQETNRFLDTKAGVLTIFQTSLLVGIITVLANPSDLEIINILIDKIGSGRTFTLLFLIGSYMIVVLCYHIFTTLRGIYPKEDPRDHVETDGVQTKNLFFLYRLDHGDRIQPSLDIYLNELAAMNNENIAQEYAKELLKLSYIRKKKSENVIQSFRVLTILAVSILVFIVFLIFIVRIF